MRKYRVHFLVGVIVALLLAVNVLAAITRPKPAFDLVADRSTYRFNWYGWRAFYTTLAALGYNVSRLEDTPQNLPADCRQLWIVMPSEKLEPAELRALRRFVERGGILVCSWDLTVAEELFDSNEARNAFPELAGLDLDYGLYTRFFYAPHVAEEGKSYELTATEECDLTEGADVVMAVNGTRVEKPEAPGARIILRDDWGPALIRQPIGAGHLLFIADPDILSNKFLRPAKCDNVVLGANIAHLARGGPIMFDEYHHGFRAAETLGALFAQWGGRFGAIQLAVVLALVLLTRARRYGGIRPLRLPSRRSALEYVGSLAALYESAQAREVASWALYHAARRRLAGVSRLATTATDEELVAHAAARRRIDPRAAAAALADARTAAAQCAGDGQLVQVARQLESLGREFDRA